MKKGLLLKTHLIILLTIGIQPLANACSCWPYEPVFCRIVNENHHIVRAVVTEHIDFHLMEVDILENINQEITENTVVIYGQDGFTCGEQLGQFNLQDTLILAVMEWQISGESYWYLEGFCGLHFLRCDNGVVSGQIGDTLTTQSLQDFKDNLFECLDMQVPTEEVSLEATLTIFPNPASAAVQIVSDKADILSVAIFDSQGRLVNQQDNFRNLLPSMDVSGLRNGVYFIRIETGDGVLVRRFLKV